MIPIGLQGIGHQPVIGIDFHVSALSQVCFITSAFDLFLTQPVCFLEPGLKLLLNRECDIKVTYSRLAEWRRGRYTPSQKVLSQMLYKVLFWALVKAGIQATEAQLDALEELIWKVNVMDGERNIELL